MLDSLQEVATAYGFWIGVVSLVTVIGAVPAVPWVICRLPPDYFMPGRRPSHDDWRAPAWLRWPLIAAKNVLGLVLVVLGLVMLVTPGQGILTLIAGIGLMNFPGKYRLERRIARMPGVLRAINWIRARRGHPPMQTPPRG